MRRKHIPLPFIRTLLEGKSEEEIVEAEERFYGFLDLAERIQARLENEKEP